MYDVFFIDYREMICNDEYDNAFVISQRLIISKWFVIVDFGIGLDGVCQLPFNGTDSKSHITHFKNKPFHISQILVIQHP